MLLNITALRYTRYSCICFCLKINSSAHEVRLDDVSTKSRKILTNNNAAVSDVNNHSLPRLFLATRRTRAISTISSDVLNWIFPSEASEILVSTQNHDMSEYYFFTLGVAAATIVFNHDHQESNRQRTRSSERSLQGSQARKRMTGQGCMPGNERHARGRTTC